MRRPGVRALALFVGLSCATPLQAQSDSASSTNAAAIPAAPAAAVKVAAGERLTLELLDSLHTRHNRKGDQAHFTTVNDVRVGSELALPRGSSVRATLTKVKKPGRAGAPAKLRLHFEEIILPDGTTLPLQASVLGAGGLDIQKGKRGASVKGEGATDKRDALLVAMGAGQGALVGAAVGGGKGAAYGGAIGAGIGLIEILMRKGPHLDLPAGTLFEIQLDQALLVPADSASRFAQLASQQVSHPDSSTSSGPSDSLASSASSASSSAGTGEESAPSSSESIPDFPADTAPAEAATRETTPPVPPGTPPPPPYDPSLGEADYTLRVNVRLVMVEAFVRDARGRLLDHLRREDFQLREDGLEQTIRHFSRDELPLAVALVVDRSGSVAPFMPELRQAAYDTLRELKPGDQVALFTFAEDVERLEDLTTDRRRVAERIARIRPGGGTNITDALYSAAQYLAAAAPDHRRAIILVSDNQATTRGFASQDRVIRSALESDVVIYSVKTPGMSLPWLGRLSVKVAGYGSVRKMTQETGGEIIDVDEVGSLRAALATVIARLKTRYTLGYQSTNQASDGAFRQIEVRLADRFGFAGRDYTIHAKKGYYAPTEQLASQPAPTR